MRKWAILFCTLLAGCTSFYTPHVKADHDAPKYKTDLVRCRKQVNDAASRVNNATVGKAIISLFNFDATPQRHDITVCMNGKGYPSE